MCRIQIFPDDLTIRSRRFASSRLSYGRSNALPRSRRIWMAWPRLLCVVAQSVGTRARVGVPTVTEQNRTLRAALGTA